MKWCLLVPGFGLYNALTGGCHQLVLEGVENGEIKKAKKGKTK